MTEGWNGSEGCSELESEGAETRQVLLLGRGEAGGGRRRVPEGTVGLIVSEKNPLPDPPPLAKHPALRPQELAALSGHGLLPQRLWAYGPTSRAAGLRLLSRLSSGFQPEKYRKCLREKRSPEPRHPKPGSEKESLAGWVPRGSGRMQPGAGLQASGSEDHTQGETSPGCQRGCASACEHQESQAGGAGPGKAPARGPGALSDGSRLGLSAPGSHFVRRVRKRPRRVSLGPLRRIPGREGAAIQAPAGRKQTWECQTLGPWVPESSRPDTAARYYLHEDPRKAGLGPDLDGQFSHGVAGAAPRTAAAAGALLGGSAMARVPARRTGRREAPLRPQAGAGGGRREGRAGLNRLHRAPRFGDAACHSPRRSARGPCASGGASGTPDPHARHRLRALGRRALRSRLGREARGKPGLLPPPARSPAPRQWAAPGLGARAARSLGLCLRPSASRLYSLAPGALAHGTSTHVGR